MNKRRLIILFLSLLCAALIIGGLLHWKSKQRAEQRLQEYIGRLEDAGFTLKERSLKDFPVDNMFRVHFFSDFRDYAIQEGVAHMYFDRGMHTIYFLHPYIDDKVEAVIFYYK